MVYLLNYLFERTYFVKAYESNYEVIYIQILFKITQLAY